MTAKISIIILICALPLSANPVPEFIPETSAFFLLPIPPELSPTTENTMIPYFTAPVLDQDLILAMAGRLEEKSRQLLTGRRRLFASAICSKNSSDRKTQLDSARIEQDRQFQLWRRIQDQYESYVANNLKIFRKDIAPVLEARRTARTMALERQTIISRSWQGLFDSLEKKITAPGQECEKSTVPEELPTEELFSPFYLAQFRFFTQLNALERARIILILR